ncbi:hypothetical protein LAZ67_1007770 [Cordylochernes scorpioides]|uniref:Ig-like domain-containing protein n=1 Tax=Cordylochernes scorpioides TaxID=51811 RepID=A0ABY6JZJ2_9ARAC|nr:hypothetical protein LAZ67_1007770 [Cordylochernes scorpioides]
MIQNCIRALRSESPKIQAFAFPKDLKQGAKIFITCIVFQGRPPFAIRWLKDGEVLDPKKVENIRIVTSELQSSLHFDPVNSNSGGNYTCEMKNKHGQDSYTASLNIQAPPEWLSVPQDTTALEGSTATLQCNARGSPSPQVRWTTVTGDQKSPGNSSVLVFNPVERIHAGKYRCTADNGLGPPLQHTVTLTVHCE